MARDHARVNLTIWTDPDFRALPPAAQHLYLTLWTAPELSYCGVHDWRPARMTGLSHGYNSQHIELVAACLESRHFVVIDRDTEECLVRSWARFDGLLKQPRMAISLINAYATVGSSTIRQVIVHELRKIRVESPEMTCWNDKRVGEVLEHPATSAKDLPSVSDPFGEEFAPGLDMGLPQTQPKVWGSVCTPPTPAPTPSTTTAPDPSVAEGSTRKPKAASRKRPATRLPDDWRPNATAVAYAGEKGIDVGGEAERFRLHAQANDRTQADWNASFRMWLSNARPTSNVHQLRTDDQGRTVLPPLPPKSPWGPA